MTASHCAELTGNFFRVAPDFMFLCSAKANDVRFIASLSVGHVHDDAVQPADQIDSLPAIVCTVIVPRNDRAVEYGFATDEI